MQTTKYAFVVLSVVFQYKHHVYLAVWCANMTMTKVEHGMNAGSKDLLLQINILTFH